jgi:hypothetical protein
MKQQAAMAVRARARQETNWVDREVLTVGRQGDGRSDVEEETEVRRRGRRRGRRRASTTRAPNLVMDGVLGVAPGAPSKRSSRRR